jgi:hypothetical protein
VNVSRLLVHPLWVARRTGMGATGTPTYGAPFEVAARVEWGEGVQREGADGSAATFTARIATETVINPGDRLWLPERDMTAGDYTDDDKALVPGPTGVQSVTGLAGVVPTFYLTTV